MKRKLFFALALILCASQTLSLSARKKPAERPRILISTDIGGTDPDDNQSMAHFLMYCDEFDTEGIISSPSFGEGNKEEILRMIDMYERQLPQLRKHHTGWAEPDYLRSITKQGRKGAAPLCGYSEPTEGSEWIVKCAKKESDRPLYVLVWGGLDDIAQALHDAPEIKKNIRVYWIGGPNKKWSVNSYIYIVENHPDLWMIENNVAYRAFIYESKNPDVYHMGYYDHFIKGAGEMGADFKNYYKGNPKLGDTPSLLYVMDGDPNNPEGESWGGQFVPCTHSSRAVFHRPLTAKDTVQNYAILEMHVKGPVLKKSMIGKPCMTLTIVKQKWDGYYMGNGDYMVR